LILAFGKQNHLLGSVLATKIKELFSCAISGNAFLKILSEINFFVAPETIANHSLLKKGNFFQKIE